MSNAHRLILLILVASQAAPQSLTFEVASIKPTDPSNQHREYFVTPGGGFSGRGLTLKILIARTYNLLDSQILGGADWINSERYDIQAKALRNAGDESVPNDLSKLTPEQAKILQDQFLERARALLADRFQLKFHREAKDLPVYKLVVAKGGPKIRQGTDTPRVQLRRNQIDAKAQPLASLVGILTQRLGRPVLDETGLKGNYDFNLQWAPDPSPTPPNSVAAPDPGGPSIFTAIEEQLGLKLESKRGPVEIFIIDHAERPSEN